jgi:hypothetical protein
MRRLALIAAVVALVAAGCGGTTIDGGELEDEIKEDAAALPEALVVDDVDCPSPEAETGDTFECTVVVKGEDKPLEVVQQNDDGNVTYNLAPLSEGTAGTDEGGDETSIRYVIDAVNKDVTALCDYATAQYRKELEQDENCAKAVLDEYDRPLEDYEVSVDGDTAAATDGERTVTLERQKDGSWLITDVR